MAQWSINKIAKWNSLTFPNNTPTMQYQKLRNETREYYKKGADKEEELADIYIAAASGYKLHGDSLSRLIVDLIEELMLNGIYDRKNINAKMDINKDRSWTHYRGEWRHVDN